MKKKLTKTAAAQQLNVSRTTIYNLIRRGILVPDENGLLTFDDNDSDLTNIECQYESPKFTECKENEQSVHNIAMRSPRLKDKYIATLERQNKLLEEALAQARMETLNEYWKRKQQLLDIFEKIGKYVPPDVDLNKFRQDFPAWEEIFKELESLYPQVFEKKDPPKTN